MKFSNKFIPGFLIGIVLLILSGFFSFSVLAHNEDSITVCHQTHSPTNPWIEQTINANELFSHLANGDFLVNADHPCPPVTPTPTVTPTCTPTPELKPSPTATPTPSLTPTPELTVSTPITAGNSGTTSSSTGNPGTFTCTETPPNDVANFVVVNNPLGLELEWAIVQNADHVDLRYGLHDGDWQYGALNLPNTGNYIVENLTPHTPYFFQIAGVKGCTIGNWSATYDPVWLPFQ